MDMFTTNENKGLLWKLMSENNVFGGLPENKYSQVKEIFENEIITQSNIMSGKSLTEMNKKVLSEVSKKLIPLRSIQNVQITNSDISDQRQQQFSSNLAIRQREFNKLINADKPPEIDFSDNLNTNSEVRESSALENLDSVIARREQQLNNLTYSQDSKTASDWIGIRNRPKKLNIGPKIDNGGILSKSRVTFNEPIVSEEINDSNTDTDDEESDLNVFLSQLNVSKKDIIKEIKKTYSEISVRMKIMDKLIKKLE